MVFKICAMTDDLVLSAADQIGTQTAEGEKKNGVADAKSLTK